jgi:hypothetical protein
MVDRAAVPKVSQAELAAPFDDAQGDLGATNAKRIAFVGGTPLWLWQVFQVPFRKAENHERR